MWAPTCVEIEAVLPELRLPMNVKSVYTRQQIDLSGKCSMVPIK